MNRLSLINQGFVNKEKETNIFRSWSVDSQDNAILVNAHTGTKLGYVLEDNRLIATMKWQDEQEDIYSALTVVGLNSLGEVLPRENLGAGKLLGFLLFKDTEWYSLSYNSFTETYEFLPLTLHDSEMPKKLDSASSFYVEKVYPKQDVCDEGESVEGCSDVKYGDIVVLKNLKTKNYLSKSQYDGCTLESYPILKDHPKSEFSTELLTGYFHGDGPMYCKSAECEDLSENNKKYGRHAGCAMVFWQILPLGDPQVKLNSVPKLKKQSAYDPSLIYWAFLPLFFVVILVMIFLFYTFV